MMTEDFDEGVLTKDEENRHSGGIEDKDTPDDYFAVYGDPNCRVSNDPPANENSSIPVLTFCNITEYKCFPPGLDSSDRASRVSRELDVSYDYDLYYNPEVTDIKESILPYLEESVLEHVASVLGQINCAATGRNNNKRRRRRVQGGLTLEQQNHILGINLEPRDQVDRDAACASDAAELVPGIETDCLPMEGFLTLVLGNNVSRSDELSIQKEIQSAIQEAMDTDIFVVGSSIEKVEYVGTRLSSDSIQGGTDLDMNESPALNDSRNPANNPVVTIRGNIDNNQNDNTLTNTHFGLIAAAGALLFVLPVFLYGYKRRRDSDKNKTSLQARELDMRQVWSDDEESMPSSGQATSLANKDSLALAPTPKRTQELNLPTAFDDEDILVDNGDMMDRSQNSGSLANSDSLALVPQKDLRVPISTQDIAESEEIGSVKPSHTTTTALTVSPNKQLLPDKQPSPPHQRSKFKVPAGSRRSSRRLTDDPDDQPPTPRESQLARIRGRKYSETSFSQTSEDDNSSTAINVGDITSLPGTSDGSTVCGSTGDISDDAFLNAEEGGKPKRQTLSTLAYNYIPEAVEENLSEAESSGPDVYFQQAETNSENDGESHLSARRALQMS